MSRIQLVVIALALLLPISAIAQQDSSWQLRLSNGDTLVGCALVRLKRDSLVIAQHERAFAIPVDSIGGLVHERKSRLLQGALLGTLAGVVVGGFVAAEMTNSEGFLSGLRGAAAAGYCALGGLAIGSAIGGLTGTDETYDLSGKDVHEKAYVIQTILFEIKE